MVDRDADVENESPSEHDSTIVMPRHRSRDDAEMDITPMIDITFLLLIFFLVASRMDTQADIQLPPARYATAVQTRNAVVITVAQGAADSALIYKANGTHEEQLLRSTVPEDQEKEIAQYVQEGLDDVPPKENVVIKAERGVKHREVARVAQAVGSVEDVHTKQVQLHVAVLEVQ